MTASARVSLVTLGVADVDRFTEFYARLGWSLSSASVPGQVSFFRTAGAILALYGIADLAANIGAPATPTLSGFRGDALAINCDNREQIDETLRAAEDAGATLLKLAQVAEWGGCSGYFADPDGHVWEVAHNPAWPIGADGRPILP